jgi:hypothetical protein
MGCSIRCRGTYCSPSVWTRASGGGLVGSRGSPTCSRGNPMPRVRHLLVGLLTAFAVVAASASHAATYVRNLGETIDVGFGISAHAHASSFTTDAESSIFQRGGRHRIRRGPGPRRSRQSDPGRPAGRTLSRTAPAAPGLSDCKPPGPVEACMQGSTGAVPWPARPRKRCSSIGVVQDISDVRRPTTASWVVTPTSARSRATSAINPCVAEMPVFALTGRRP